MYSIAEAVDTRSHRTGLVEEVPEGQVEEACDHRVAAVDIVDILALLVVVDNSAEDTVDARSVDHLVVDEGYTPVAVHQVLVAHKSV